MKTMRLAVLGVAIVAGAAAGIMAMGGEEPPRQVIVEATPAFETDEVLVAAGDIGVGRAIRAGDLAWKPWPRDASGKFITRRDNPNAIEEFEDAIVRLAFYEGEPMRERKVVRADGSGYMSAILPRGMLAVAVEIDPSRSAGGFILPNDRVDVILTEEGDRDDGGPSFTSRTIIQNVRVLAIDQSVEDSDEGDKVVIGETATVELTSEQAEVIASATETGSLQLALRSLADADGPDGPGPRLASGGTGTVTLVRFGKPQRVNTAN